MQSYCETFTKIAKKEARLRFLRAEGIFANVRGLPQGWNFITVRPATEAD
jgi:hypothetical protein